MKRTAWLVLCVLLIATGCNRGKAPNVLLIVVDTLRADRLGAYGNGRGLTPFMDELASRGTVFTNAYATTSWTCPSVASLMTSRFPVQHHVVSFASRLADDELTLAEILQRSGYVGAGFSGNFRLLEALGYAQGFEQWFAGDTVKEDPRGEELRRRSLAWLDQARQAAPDKPKILYLQYMEPHAPYDPPEPFRSRFWQRPDGASDVKAANERVVTLRWYELTRADVEMLQSLYDAEVASVDAELRILFAELEQRGFLENAVVVLTADHGEEFWEHGALTHGTNLYNVNVRIPLIVIAPGYAHGVRVEQNVSLVDIAPTLLELLGLAREPRFEGRSLVSVMRPEPAAARPETAAARDQALRSGDGSNSPRDTILQLESTGYGLDVREHTEGLVRGSTKLLIRPGAIGEVYDLARDPGEKIANPPALESQLTPLTKELEGDRADLGSRAGARAEAAKVDDATREKLRALGYHF